MTNERARAPYMPQGLLLERVTNLFTQYPDMTFMVRDVTSMIDFELNREGVKTPAHNETVRKIMNSLTGTEISRRHAVDNDVLRYQAKQESLLFYSFANPVPVYTQDMVDLYDEYPRPRQAFKTETPRLSAGKTTPLQEFVAATHGPAPTVTDQRVSILHGLVDQLVKDLTETPKPPVEDPEKIARLEEQVRDLLSDNSDLARRNSELRAQLNKIRTAMGL